VSGRKVVSMSVGGRRSAVLNAAVQEMVAAGQARCRLTVGP